ncbi:hypothetical protein BC629DRAFT_715125 [Irpex lacteus]|nr:hypothetical protein BC629DRAFT_715125 [Irpex lacteus]
MQSLKLHICISRRKLEDSHRCRRGSLYGWIDNGWLRTCSAVPKLPHFILDRCQTTRSRDRTWADGLFGLSYVSRPGWISIKVSPSSQVNPHPSFLSSTTSSPLDFLLRSRKSQRVNVYVTLLYLFPPFASLVFVPRRRPLVTHHSSRPPLHHDLPSAFQYPAVAYPLYYPSLSMTLAGT